jgi:hypothetical protein
LYALTHPHLAALASLHARTRASRADSVAKLPRQPSTRSAPSTANTPGIRTRHSRTCRTRDGGTCNCKPAFEAWVYSKRDGKKIRKSFPTLAAARGWRIDAAKQVKDRRRRAPSSRTLRQEVEEWLGGAPMVTPDRWVKVEEADFKAEVPPLILKHNAARLLGLS